MRDGESSTDTGSPDSRRPTKVNNIPVDTRFTVGRRPRDTPGPKNVGLKVAKVVILGVLEPETDLFSGRNISPGPESDPPLAWAGLFVTFGPELVTFRHFYGSCGWN